ncbi:CU044_2847 family protein [Phytohabitans rumicis]|uniref:Trypsin-co-occurring domain-containing protein n=1 Tax=Phytohabitans rumicis TaxID=1076125 RepID=A0A6V8LHH0_9ACTN|nr:CU044_2847 family protein [Phytohabitans rumicis]GFJ93556.1 hypothetical protein Prum_071980 [Phytohabitans rumicis]
MTDAHGNDDTLLVPIDVGGQRVIMAARRIDTDRSGTATEQPIAGRLPQLQQVIDGLAAFAEQVANRLKDTEASRVTVNFGCQVAVESGTFVAVIGKASTSSTFTVELEWTNQT